MKVVVDTHATIQACCRERMWPQRAPLWQKMVPQGSRWPALPSLGREMAVLGLPASPQLTAEEEEEQLPADSSTWQWGLVLRK